MMTAMRVSHRLRTGQLAVEVAPGFFKIVGEPIRTRLEIDVRYGYAEPVDSNEVIEVSQSDLARKDWLADGQARIVQAANERARRFLGESE